MSVKSYFKSLIEKHAELENQIRSLYTSHHPDIKIKQLKKQRLKIKEQINNLQASIENLEPYSV